MDKIKNWGQVFTPEEVVKYMFSLSKNNGKILEPSSGNGNFVNYINSNSKREILGIEIDESYKSEKNLIMNFFDYEINKKYETIIGNPPYVSYKNIEKETLEKLKKNESFCFLDNRSNLYLYFIKKCYEHLTDNGEIIFITPREFIKNTSSIRLNNFLYENGTITHWIEFGDEIIFKGFSPNVVVWRYEKNNFERVTITNKGLKNFNLTEGQFSFSDINYTLSLNDFFEVKVGGVSGADDVFTNELGNKDFVCSYTKKTGKLKKMFYNVKNEYLENFKDLLINRKIKNFNNDNWWQWGRNFFQTNSERIYVNCKTRDMKPFFIHPCKNYDGSILALIPKKEINLEHAVELLNSINWDELGFKVGGRLCFSQRALQNIKLPFEFNETIK